MAPLPPPRLQCIKDHCLAATTTSASPIRPHIAPSESNLFNLLFYEKSSSSDLSRAATSLGIKIMRHHSLPILFTRQNSVWWRHRLRHINLSDIIKPCHHYLRQLAYISTQSAITSSLFDWPMIVAFDSWLFARVDFLQSRCSLPSFSHRFHFCSPFYYYYYYFFFFAYFACKWRIRTCLLLVRRQSSNRFCNFCKCFGHYIEICYNRNKSVVSISTATVTKTESV